MTILHRHEVFYCEELRQMEDLDGTYTEESNPEQLVSYNVKLQLPETCLKRFPSTLNCFHETQSMHFVSPISGIEGLVSCKYNFSRCMKPTASEQFHRCACRATVHGFLSYWLLLPNRASINLPMLETTR
jgi:hypothetical protein